MIDLRANPFYLDDEAEKWVYDTLSELDDNGKIGQIFCLESISGDVEDMQYAFDKIEPGAMMHRPNTIDKLQTAATQMQAKCSIPMLIAGNYCHGGSDVAVDGQPYATCMGVGATNDTEYAFRQGVLAAESAKIGGGNWAYAPVSDINFNFESSVINTRSYGDKVDLVGDMAAAYIKGCQSVGVASSFKHFPGDGMDIRDQHVTLSVNSLSCEEWDASYGAVYKKCIEAGALTCMIGHITMPAYSMKLNPSLNYGECLPGSLSKELMTDLLRGKLGFNGMIVSDAAQMAGMSAQLKREDAVPLCIEAGCDMFLFYRDFDEDYEYMKKGLETGKLSRERLDEAVIRILATKAALGLHKGVSALPPVEDLHKPEYKVWAEEVADKSITLAKNLREDLFPITPEKNKKLIVYSHVSDNVEPPVMRPEMEKRIGGDKQALFKYFVKQLEEEGFDVTVYEEELASERKLDSYHSKEAVSQYSVALHFCNVQPEHGRAARINYKGHCSNDAADTDMYIPNILISMGSPYLLLDAPRVKTCINCYTPSEHTVDALIDKLVGRSEFKGVSPVDQFCGLEDTKW
ncbi:MAG: glycoside hydrolase family 3 N-terminal domain-containing protein [Clostridia bacterium]|nr:glycoside hydrolase family 3 N-terminal domain-containing protein [Clostridia bacterium]